MIIKVGEDFTTSIKVIENNVPVISDLVIASIEDKVNKKFFNGVFWSNDEVKLTVPHLKDGVYELCFTPDKASTFEVTIQSRNYPLGKSDTLYSYEDGTENSPILVTSSTLFSQDGSDTTVVDGVGKEILGATVSCYDSKGDIVAVSQSNSLGEWEMTIGRGKYFFVFEKEGYISVSLERVIV